MVTYPSSHDIIGATHIICTFVDPFNHLKFDALELRVRGGV